MTKRTDWRGQPLGADDDHSMAIDVDGTSLPWTPAEVKAHMNQMIEDGEIVLVIVRAKGELAVQSMIPPSRELLDVLEAATRAYRISLRGH